MNRKEHWENLYLTKQLNQVSWYQPTPETSLNLIEELNLPKTAKIIDIGGGDSFLADYLLALGYQDITVLDIAEAAFNRAKKRLGLNAKKIQWIVADAANFKPTVQYDCWHDRAAFHFLTEENEIKNYITTLQQSLNTKGSLIIGTFSEQGPEKCSGISIRQYSETTMAERFKEHFNKIKCLTIDHQTPFNTQQNFVFCRFQKKETEVSKP